MSLRSRLLAVGMGLGVLCLLVPDWLDLATTMDGASVARTDALMKRALGYFGLAGAVLAGLEAWAARRRAGRP